MNSHQTIGILGGMGPFATAAFFQKILELTPAKKDWEHLHLVIDNHPQIPSRSRYYLYQEASPLPEIIQACKKLQEYPVDFIAIPCNSASAFLDAIQAEVAVPILNIMQVTAKALYTVFPKIKRVAVMGGVITYREKIYAKYLGDDDVEYVHHNEKLQSSIEQIIEEIKLNNMTPRAMHETYAAVDELKKSYRVDGIILGCTEFGCLQSLDLSIPTIDSSTELARYIVHRATAERVTGEHSTL
jgi:aspartate racemase